MRIALSSLPLLAVLSPFAARAQDAARPRPNVLIVMTDDQGYGDFSCHGNPVLKTPHIDRLHAESVRLTDFHVAPMCTPTRGQLMTGRDALHNGATSVTAGRAFLRRGVPTMPEIFADNGYRTGIFGKWHLGDNYPHRPMDRGFQEAVYHLGWGISAAPEFANTLIDGRYFHNGEPAQFAGYITDFWFDRAMAWMRERKERGEPFLCYLPTNAPHAPHVVDDRYSAPYQGRQRPAKFFGMIANIDENIGRLESFLSETGLRDNTLVIFMTDNGGTAGVNVYNAGMRGRKTQYYDGGHRVPCFVRWPRGSLSGGHDIAVPTQNQDLLPTLIELCGLQPPPDAGFDGVSLAGLLKGTRAELPDRMLIVQYGQILQKWDCAVIWSSWRLVKGEELYDIVADPGQETDVAGRRADVVAKMRAHYEHWWAGIEPRLGEYVATSLGSGHQDPVQLTSSDWQDIYSDNAGHVRQAAGGPQGGEWNVEIERAGEYEFALRRWPPELDLPLTASESEGSKAFPIAAARLTIAGREASARTAPGDKQAVMRVKLPPGQTRLHAWFQDADGNDLCGAFYVSVTRRGE
jgi:arylsulfatase A-like enzyme